MCDFSGKLIAWMDRELADDEAAAVERHVQGCAECRSQVDAFEDMSRALVSYCDAVAELTPRCSLPHWAPMISGAAAVLALLLVFLQPSVKPVPVPLQVVQAQQAISLQTAPRAARPAHPRHAISRKQTPSTNWELAEPAIQIAIPAEAIFPPGAVPEGVNFVAELSIAADGSAQGLRLQP